MLDTKTILDIIIKLFVKNGHFNHCAFVLVFEKYLHLQLRAIFINLFGAEQIYENPIRCLKDLNFVLIVINLFVANRFMIGLSGVDRIQFSFCSHKLVWRRTDL